MCLVKLADNIGRFVRYWTERVILVSCVIAFVLFLISPLEYRLRTDWGRQHPHLAVEQVTESNDGGTLLVILGGFRTFVANLLWLEIYHAWELRDRTRLERLIYSVTQLSPETEYFWVHAAGMLAYDVPHWRIELAGGPLSLNGNIQNKLHRIQAEAALALLGEGLRQQPIITANASSSCPNLSQ